MSYYGLLRAVVCFGALTFSSASATAQVRGMPQPTSRHARSGRHHDRAVPPPEPAPTGPWTASRAHFILSAESLLGASGYEETATGNLEGESVEGHASGASLHLFKGAEFVDPWGEARLGFDAVLQPGITLGTGIGYATVNQETMGSSASDISLFIVVPRLGFMLGPSRYLGVWLRAGLGYASVAATAPGASGVAQRALDLVVDPQLVITPFPHVGILVGPALNFGLNGSVSRGSNRVDFTSSSYGINAGLALLF